MHRIARGIPRFTRTRALHTVSPLAGPSNPNNVANDAQRRDAHSRSTPPADDNSGSDSDPPPSNSSDPSNPGSGDYTMSPLHDMPEQHTPVEERGLVPSNLPTPHPDNHIFHAYTPPPFDTHRLVTSYARSFSLPIAEQLMHSTRALLSDRLNKVRRDGLMHTDLENQAYLFRAALSEMRTEAGVRGKTDSAAVKAQAAAMRREVDALSGRMNEAIATLKHEYVELAHV